MAAAVAGFLEVVFDVAPPTEVFLRDGRFVLDQLLTHPALLPNMVFHCTWKFFFGTYAPKRYFIDFTETGANTANLSEILQSKPFDLAAKLFALYNETALKQYMSDLDKKVNHVSFAKEFVARKLCQRFGEAFEHRMINANPVRLYAELLAKSSAEPKQGKNLISGRYLQDLDQVKKVNTTFYDAALDSIISDRHFIYKLVNNPVILIDEGVTLKDHVLQGIVGAFKGVGQGNPVVINTGKNHITIDGVYVFNTSLALARLIPTVCSHFVCISRKRYPEVRPFSRERRFAIYYLSAWEEAEIVNNAPSEFKGLYDRCITSLPRRLANPPLKTYRIPEWIETKGNVSRQKMPLTRRVLIGPSSTPPDGGDSPQRVDVYSATNMLINYDEVIDTHKEIPIEVVYKHLASGAKVCREDIYLPPSTLTRMLFSKELFERVWKDHARLSCPVYEPNPANNVLLFHEFVFNYAERMRHKAIHAAIASSDKTVLLIDTRENPYSVVSVLFALMNVIPNEWACKVMTSKKAHPFYMEWLSPHGVQVIHLPEADTTRFDIDVYNGIIKSKTTWEAIGGEHVLIIQDDGMLVKEGVEGFLAYDYVGAPWVDAEPNAYIKVNINPSLVGNGGLSLRSVQMAKHITEKYETEKHALFYDNQVEIPEDVYFVQALVRESANLPSASIAGRFSTEQVIDQGSIGFHKVWAYHPRERVEAFFSAALA